VTDTDSPPPELVDTLKPPPESQPTPYSDKKKENLFGINNVDGSPPPKIDVHDYSDEDNSFTRRARKKGGTSHKPKFTRRKNKNSSKRKTIKKRKMPKRKNKTRRNK